MAKQKQRYELQDRDGNVIATTHAFSEKQAYRNFLIRGEPVESELFHIAGGNTHTTAPVVQQSDLFRRRP